MNVHWVFPVSDVAYTPDRLLLHAPQNYQASKQAKINTISVYLQHSTIYNASEQHFHEIFQTLSPDLILKEFEAYLAMEVNLSLQIKEVSNSVKWLEDNSENNAGLWPVKANISYSIVKRLLST